MKKFLLLLLLSNFSLIHSQIAVTAVSNNINCNGDANGMININAAGGTAPYIYSLIQNGTMIFGPSPTGYFIGLSSGIYTIKVDDALTNSGITIVTITEPSALFCSVNVNNDSATALTSGGTPPYSYSIDGNTYLVSNVFNFLSSGIHTLIVQDSNGCFSSHSFTIPTLSTSTFDNFHFTSNSNLFSFSNGTKIENLFVYNILGEKILSKNINESSSQIDFSTLTKGIYFVKLSSGNEEKTIKISKN